MNADEFTRYLIKNRGVVVVGKPDTLEVAKQMVADGYLYQEWDKAMDEPIVKDDNPIFRVTTSGITYLATYLAHQPKEKMKELVAAAQSEEVPKP
jgi:hypothetical protein